jgi:hypothetical protein
MINITSRIEDVPLIRMKLLREVPCHRSPLLKRRAAPLDPLRLRLDVRKHVMHSGVAAHILLHKQTASEARNRE